MKRTHILPALLLILGSTIGHAQTTLPPAAVPKGMLTTAEGKKIEFLNLTTGPEQYSFKNVEVGKYQSLPADQVLRIQQQTGTEAGKWALYFGVSGLIGSTLGVLSAKSDADIIGREVDNSKLVPIVIGLTAASTLIGLAIGSGKKKYHTVYDAPSKDTTSSPFAPFRIRIASPAPRSIGIGISYHLSHTSR